MSKRLLIVNVLLATAAVVSVAYIARAVTAPTALPTPARPRSAPPPKAAPVRVAEPQRSPASAYSTVATRNVFSPTRSEATGAAAGGNPTPAFGKPNLYGIVLREGAAIAYLEDPATKRVSGYRLGDAIAGGTVKAISADHVVIARPDGQMDVRLRDPSKPRPPAPGQPPTPGQLPVPGAVGPTVAPPTVGGTPPSALTPPPAIQPPTPGVAPPRPFVIPGRRPLPSMGSRVPPVPASDATPQ